MRLCASEWTSGSKGERQTPASLVNRVGRDLTGTERGECRDEFATALCRVHNVQRRKGNPVTDSSPAKPQSAWNSEQVRNGTNRSCNPERPTQRIDRFVRLKANDHHWSRNDLSLRDRLGCFSFRSAFASIWRIRSRVTLNCWPTSSRV